MDFCDFGLTELEFGISRLTELVFDFKIPPVTL